jgi:hypothetical protein
MAYGRVYASDHQDSLIDLYSRAKLGLTYNYVNWCESATEYNDDAQEAAEYFKSDPIDKNPWVTGCAGYAGDLWDTLDGR